MQTYKRLISVASFNVIALLCFNACSSNTKKVKPNVVMIVVDDMNGCSTRDQYPYIKTPHIDELRKQSVNVVN